ncbi:MAG: sensor hybrid histidine kinase [Chthoniobacteraceae bacterium]|nr:sensor hybrid histidine kinase [Chthoniobacteraceae bacterium]
MEAQQHLFEPFNENDSPTTRKYGGTGLGLAISRQLVALMHGEIGMVSETGKGSMFWFTARFPRQATVPPRREPAELAGLRTLIVDDNATIRKILTAQLTSLRIRCTAVTGGCEALEILRRQNAGPDLFILAILDMQMPETDGMRLAEAIKADPAIAATRLIMLGSLEHNIYPKRVKVAGIEQYLTKPAKQSRLHECLAAMMGRQ